MDKEKEDEIITDRTLAFLTGFFLGVVFGYILQEIILELAK